MRAFVSDAVLSIEGCDTASISMRHGPRTYTAAAHDRVALELDEAQYAEDTGPCLTAFRSLVPVLLPHIVPGPGRYERFRAGAAEHGAMSSFSSPFKVNDRLRGSLNLYAFSPNAFDIFAEERAKAVSLRIAATLGSSGVQW